MDENLSRGYIQLGKARRMNELRFANNGIPKLSPPIDKYNLVYLSLILAGAGFLLPYNSFVIAVDYFQSRYPQTSIMFDMSTVYILTAFLAVLLNNVLVETLSLSTRITFGYLISFLTLNFVVICEVWYEVFGVATSYTINLAAIAVVSFGCTVQQSSFYGYTSMLPTRYTQAVMAGESAAGFWVSINRIITKSVLDDERGNTAMFFVLSISIIVLCFILQQRVYRTEFVQYYVTLCQDKNKITLEPQEDAGLMDPLDQTNDLTKGQYGVLKLQSSPSLGPESASGSIDNATGQFFEFSFSNPVYDPSAPSHNPPYNGTTYKVEDIIISRGSYGSIQSSTSNRWAKIKRGLYARLEVSKLIYPYMISIALAYAVTLCLYPGIVSEIMSCTFGSWMPVVLMTAFNGADLFGKMLATIQCNWTRSQLLNFSCARCILIPLFLMCAIPRIFPVFSNEWAPILLSLMLGMTNGIVGSVPMVLAPSKVAIEHRELAGNIMTLSYTSGLTIGSILAYLLAACLGPRVTFDELCKKINHFYYPIVPPIVNNNTNLTLNSNSNTNNITTHTITNVAKITKKLNQAMKKTTKLPKIKTTTIASLLSTVFIANNDILSNTDNNNNIFNNITTTTINNLISNITSIDNN